MRNWITGAVAVLAATGLIGAWALAQQPRQPSLVPRQNQEQTQEEEHPNDSHSGVTRAVAMLVPTLGNEARGLVIFTKVEGGVEVKGRIEGLTPGKHGFHIHEYGDQTSPDGEAAGDHFNPTDAPHAGRDSTERHIGDLGNIEADENGSAIFEFVDPKILFEGRASILGRGLVVHEDPDDLESQPAGDAGARVAVGVIGVANPDTPAEDEIEP